MQACRCILLDLGQVLVGFDFRRFGEWIMALTGLNSEQLRSAMTANGLAHKYETGLLEDTDFHREVCRRVKTDIPWHQFIDAWNDIFFPTPLISEDLVVTLSRRCTLWVVSNTNRIHFDFIQTRYSHLLRHFAGFILSHEVGLAKPDPAIYRLALEKAGVEAREALFVDDQPANVEAARGVGIDSFQFLNPDQFVHELYSRQLL
ncbi:MAG TPA: HAD family phosphatase [Acidobacteriota bacterium]|nr:HAD family phosphatase [Acidobacteriota bacterium]